MKNNILWVAALPMLVGCSQNSVVDAPRRSVIVTKPQSVSQTIVHSYPGVVEEASLTKIGFKTAGQILRIYVREGDRVSKGQLIAQLDTKDYQLGLQSAQIQFDQMQAEFDRIKQLYEAKSISRNDYEKAEAGLRQLEIQLQNNKNTIDYTRLTAPFDGYVMSVASEEQEMVDAGTPLVSLMDMSRLEVVADVPLQEYAAGTAGATFSSTFTSGSSEGEEMSLVSVSPKADGNQLFQLRLAFKSKPAGLTPGQNVVVSVSRGRGAGAGAFTLPVHSIFECGGQRCVWVLNADSTLSRRVVASVEVDSKGRAVVTDGLVGNESVVRAGASTLQEGEKVHVLPENKESNVGNLL